MTNSTPKTLGKAIDEVIAALEDLDERSRTTAIKAACEHLGLTPSVGTPELPTIDRGSDRSSNLSGPAKREESVQDVRSLREAKNPKTAIEMACIVAYYLEALAPPSERKSEVTKTDLDKYFKQAGQKLPKRIDQVLIDAKAAGYLDSTGRGKYRLNPVGHNLVVHTLPRGKA